MSNEERLRSLLSDLGKATLRGVKKCPKCGTYNGSRGLCCKNKNCDAVFKEPGERRKLSTEACKLITGTAAQVYSVRVRDKGPDYRGFVQLPLITNYSSQSDIISNNNINNNNNSSLITPPKTTKSATLCFVDGCERDFVDDNNTLPNCQHIQAAQRCYAEAQPLTLKSSIINKLVVNNETNQEIRLLASEASIGPLVQRVSKNIMAVKCKASPKHPLGYLHFSFYTIKLNKDKTEHKYYCSCTALKAKTNVNNRCVHFYACICAFASDEKLCEEFSYYIDLEVLNQNIERPIQNSFDTTYQFSDEDKIIEMVSTDLESLTDNTHFVIFQDNTLTIQNLDGGRLDLDSISLDTEILSTTTAAAAATTTGIDVAAECQGIELFQDNGIVSQQVDPLMIGSQTRGIIYDETVNQSNIDARYNLVNAADFLLGSVDGGTIKVLDNNNQAILDVKGIKLLESIIDNDKIIDNNCIQFDCDITSPTITTTLATPQLQTSTNKLQQSTSVKRKRDEKLTRNKNKTGLTTRKYLNSSDNNFDEDNTYLSFTKWLASITERINQTMHFQFDGKPEPLVFHVPQLFFDCLRERISTVPSGKKKRLPNSTTAFVRKDGVPLGTFTKYTWQITNIIHVKSIFDTQFIPLEITRSFIQTGDGTYELYKREETEMDRFKKTGNNPLIKPLEMTTFLKVGHTSPHQIEPTPFLIEWIPDILPISKIGELRIRFEYGHIKNVTSQKQRKMALLKNY